MSINKLGPKEIYVSSSQYNEVRNLCQDDTPESLEKVKKMMSSSEGEFLNGYCTINNILMEAAGWANVNLVQYIVENADPKILDMRDENGFSALLWALSSYKPTEKVIACAQLLIQAGANINARCTYEKYSLSNLPPPESALDAQNFIGSNSLGMLAMFLSMEKKAEEIEKYELLIQLFLASGATQAYLKGIGWFSAEDAINEQDTSKRARYSRILKAVSDKSLNWQKTRLLFLGQRDQNSSLTHLSEDLRNRLFKTITQITI